MGRAPGTGDEDANAALLGPADEAKEIIDAATARAKKNLNLL